MRLRGENATVDLVLMGHGSGGQDQPVRETSIELTDGSWTLQYRGLGAPRRDFRGEFIPGGTAEAEWTKMYSLPGQILELIETAGNTETVIARGRLSGNLRIEDPDLRNGKAIWRRWRFSFLEFAQTPLPTPASDNVLPEPAVEDDV